MGFHVNLGECKSYKLRRTRFGSARAQTPTGWCALRPGLGSNGFRV